MSSHLPRQLADLGDLVAADGIEAHLPAVAAMSVSARAAGVAEAVVAVLLDPREPYVARERAFAVAAAGLLRAARSPAVAQPSELTLR